MYCRRAYYSCSTVNRLQVIVTQLSVYSEMSRVQFWFSDIQRVKNHLKKRLCLGSVNCKNWIVFSQLIHVIPNIVKSPHIPRALSWKAFEKEIKLDRLQPTKTAFEMQGTQERKKSFFQQTLKDSMVLKEAEYAAEGKRRFFCSFLTSPGRFMAILQKRGGSKAIWSVFNILVRFEKYGFKVIPLWQNP